MKALRVHMKKYKLPSLIKASDFPLKPITFLAESPNMPEDEFWVMNVNDKFVHEVYVPLVAFLVQSIIDKIPEVTILDRVFKETTCIDENGEIVNLVFNPAKALYDVALSVAKKHHKLGIEYEKKKMEQKQITDQQEKLSKTFAKAPPLNDQSQEKASKVLSDLQKSTHEAFAQAGINAEGVRKRLVETVGSFYAPAMIFGYSYSKIPKDHKQAQEQLKAIAKMDHHERASLLSVLGTSLLQFLDRADGSGPVSKIDDKFIEKAIEEYKTPDADTLKTIRQPALQGSPYRNLAVNNESIIERVSNAIPSPDGIGGVIVLNDRVVIKSDSNMITQRAYSERSMLENMLKNVDPLGKESLRSVCVSALHVPLQDADMPKDYWTRATVALKVDKESTAFHKNVEGVTMYVQSSMVDYKKINKFGNRAAGSKNVIDWGLSSIPTNAYSAEHIAIYMVLAQTNEGKKAIDNYELILKETYPKADMRFYKNYYHLVDHFIWGTMPNLFYDHQSGKSFPAHEFIPLFEDYYKNIRSYMDVTFDPRIMKELANNYSVKNVVASELSIAGSIQIPPLALVREVITPKMTCTVISCLGLALSMGFNVVLTDGKIGQDTFGEFVDYRHRSRRDYGLIDLRPSYTEPRDRFETLRRGVAVPAKTNVLVDVMVQGRLYNPQREEKFQSNEEFMGKKMFVGDIDSECFYSIPELMEFDVFCVHVGLGFFYPQNVADKMKLAKDRKALFDNYFIKFTPSIITDVTGIFLIGARKRLVEAGGGLHFEPSVCIDSFVKLRTSVLALVASKSLALLTGLEGYPSDYKWLDSKMCSFLNSFPHALESLRLINNRKIGTKEAYEKYVRMNKDKAKEYADHFNTDALKKVYSTEFDFGAVDKNIRDAITSRLDDADEILKMMASG